MDILPLDEEIMLVALENNVNKLVDKKEMNDNDFKVDVSQFQTDFYYELLEDESIGFDYEENSDLILDKEKTMIELVEQLEVYKLVYKLPIITISNKDWDKIFDVIYDLFIDKNIEELFYTYMDYLLRIVLATSLVNKQKEINKQNFIDCLHWIAYEHLNEEDINYIKNKLRNKCKIIDLNSHPKFDKYLK